jgi:hypothetical protein
MITRDAAIEVAPEKQACLYCGGEMMFCYTLRDGYEDDRDDPDAFAYFYRCRSCAATSPWSKSESSALRLLTPLVKPANDLARLLEAMRRNAAANQSAYLLSVLVGYSGAGDVMLDDGTETIFDTIEAGVAKLKAIIDDAEEG